MLEKIYEFELCTKLCIKYYSYVLKIIDLIYIFFIFKKD